VSFPLFSKLPSDLFPLRSSRVKREELEMDCAPTNIFLMDSSLDQTLLKLRRALPDLKREFPLQRLALFGSAARGEMGAKSDVDILAEVSPSIGLNFVTLAERLEKIIEHRIDLVSRRAIKPSLWKQIEADLIDV
jgi:predicted nucleotidyltransferase